MFHAKLLGRYGWAEECAVPSLSSSVSSYHLIILVLSDIKNFDPMAARNITPSPPAYDHAVTALPTRAELLTMSAAQLEHQEEIERIEQDRKVRALELARLEPHATAARYNTTTVDPVAKSTNSGDRSNNTVTMAPDSPPSTSGTPSNNDISALQPLPLAEAQRCMTETIARGWTQSLPSSFPDQPRNSPNFSAQFSTPTTTAATE